MIHRPECIPQILEIMPDFQERWGSYLEYWEDKTPGLCTDLSEFADYITERISQGRHEGLERISI